MPTPRKATAKKTTRKSPAESVREKRPAHTEQRTLAQKRVAAMGSDAPSSDEYAPTVWGTDQVAGSLHDLIVPSGQKVLVQKPEPTLLMREGMLDDLDMLSTILTQVSGKGKAAKDIDTSHLLKNPQMVKSAITLFDRVICAIVIKPEITPDPADPADRVKGKIYPSSIDLEDKSFIFNWAMGDSASLRRFPGESEEDLATLGDGEGS